MSRKNVEDIYPLTPMQQGMLFHTLVASETGVYFVQHGSTLVGPLDVPAFVKAWQEVVSRHAVLRTAFVWERRDVPLQVVRERVTLPVVELDLRALSPDEQAARVAAFAAEDRRRGFHLAKAPLIRLSLLRLSDDAHRLYVSSHHTLLDGWSTQIVYKEAFALYNAYSRGAAPTPPLDRPRPYGDYIGWLQQQDRAEAEAFWRRELGTFTAPTELWMDRALPADVEPGVAQARLELTEAESAELTAFARQRQLTLSTVLQGAWAILCSRYSGEEDVVFGTTVSGRSAPVPGIEKMVGLFINTLPVRARVDPAAPAGAFLAALQDRQAESRDYEHSALVDVQEWSGAPRGAPLFQSLVVFENYPVEEAAFEGMRGITIRDMKTVERPAYPVTVIGSHRETLLLRATYERSRFDGGTMERLLGHLRALLLGVAREPDRPVGDLAMITEGERQTLLVAWNKTARDYPRDASIHALFAQEAARAPGAVALSFGAETLSYGELHARSNQVAHHLRKLGVDLEMPVGLYARRSFEMIVGVLGILKAGGAYMPLDPDLPASRIAWMLEDANARVVITAGPPDDMPFGDAIVVSLDALAGEIALEPDTDPPSGAGGGSLAYLMYTSGSTGTPKGVQVVHRGVTRLVKNTNFAHFSSDEVFLQLASIAFDASTLEIWGPLLNGGRLVLPPPGAQSLDDIGEIVRSRGVTTMWLTAGLFNAMIDNDPEGLRPLRQLLVGGEALSVPHIQKALATLPGVQLINGYGPTEGTTFSCCHSIDRADGMTSIPIGRPIANTTAHVLDARMQPVPIGVPGELYVGGDGLARGYLNRPELTEERFVAHPFDGDPTARLYKTGDLVRWLPDGTIAFLGRRDHQVKIRGFRIELGEIEAALGKIPRVAEAVVLARESVHDGGSAPKPPGTGDKRLVAYVVPAAEPYPAAEELWALLEAELPEYMIPSAFVVLDRMPLTPNGKVDRNALPAPDARAGVAVAMVAPRNPVEEMLASIWAEVLEVPRVGAHDDFFDLGGHSLAAAVVMGRVTQVFQVEIPFQSIFETPTLAAVAELVSAALRAGHGALAPPITRAPAGTAPVLSFAQERFWFLAQLEPNDPSYVVPLLSRLEGALDRGALARALSEVVRRHEVLRTTFASDGGKPAAVVHAGARVDLPVTRWPERAPAEREAAARAEAAAEARRPFDLATGPLLRARLFEIDSDVHLLLVTMHHVVTDAWSLGILSSEIGTLYAAFAAGRPSPLGELPIQYADYVAWQRAWLSGEVFERQLAYWKENLGDAARTLDLPTDRRRPAVASHRGGRRLFTLSPTLGRALKDLSRREGVTLFMTLLAAFDVLLHRYSGQGDISVGTPIANRTRGEVEGLVGLFLNTLVLRTELDGALTFRELLARVRATCLGAYAHQDMPFERLVQELDPARDPSRAPLFDVSFTIQSAIEPMLLPGLNLRREGVENTTAKFDISLVVQDRQDDLAGMLEYASDLFDPETIDAMAKHLEVLLQAITRSPDKPLRDLPLLADDERRALLAGFGDTASPLPEACIHELFEAQAAATPDALAVCAGSARLTYGELDRRANQLAHHLRARGVGPDVLVGVCLPRSPETLIGVLGVLKAGGAYVALDPAHPRERLAFMIADTGMSAVLTQHAIAQKLARAGAEVIRLDAGWPEIAESSDARPDVDCVPEQLAYVIYTSGSTGTPKGVELRHAGLVNLALWHRRTYDVGPADRATLLAAPGFDAAVWEIWPYLVSGACLFIPDEETRGAPERLAAWIVEQGVTLSFLPTPLAEAVLAKPWPSSTMDAPPGEPGSAPKPPRGRLRAMLTGGDRLQRRPPADLPFTLVNHYGPTEYTVVTTAGVVWPDGDDAPSIGEPIDNTRVYVLDAQREPVPIGVPGELYIGGRGIARGYLNLPDLTLERFVPNPFIPGERLYRTGDIVRFRRGGDLEFLRRLDDQVKIRGFRIELGEVESALSRHPAVRRCAVVTIAANGESRLVAYVAGAAPLPRDLRAHLAHLLPDYMVPSAFVVLDSLPLTANGKVDRKALPAPDANALAAHAFVAPRGPVEEAIAAIFSEVLGVADVGAHAGFFELGGHSLLATQAIARIRDALGVDLPLLALFEAPSPADLAPRILAALASGARPEVPPLVRAPRDGSATLPLSFGQERLWFLDKLDPSDLSYVVPSATRLRGNLDVAALGRALDEIVRRHEVLRTTFSTVDGKPIPIVHAPSPVALTVTRPTATLRDAVVEAIRPFDLAAGPLLRANLFELGDDDRVLLLTMHHIVSDGWTQGVLNAELAALYAAFVAGEPSPLPELPLQYADYAAWQRAWLSGEALDRQLYYWRERLGSAPRALDLAIDRPRPAVATHRGARIAFALPSELSQALEALSRREGATLFMTLLAAFDVLLHRCSGQTDLVVGTPIANRTRAETERLIGFFVNTLAIRAEVTPDLPFRALLARVRAACLGAYAHQDTPFERLVNELAAERDPSRAPLFQVMFTLQNAPAAAIELPGLRISAESAATATSKFDLTLAMAPRRDGILGSLEYSTDLFDTATIERMIGHLVNLLQAIVANPGAPVGDLPLLGAEERSRILVAWNDTRVDYPSEACIHEIFEAQAARAPDAIALVFEERELTYGELAARANRLARALRRRGVGPDVLVGVCMDRSIELLVALYGVLAAGGAYVPLDPEYPRGRLAFMLDDANVPVILTQSHLVNALPAQGAEVIALDAAWPEIASELGGPLAREGLTLDHLAYVIYTSGSTGRPKGAMNAHRGVLNRLQWMQAAHGLNEADRVLQKTPFSFDVSVWELFWPLMFGARLVVAKPGGHREPEYLAGLIEKQGITTLHFVPSMLGVFLAEESVSACTSIRRVFCSGEALSPQLAAAFFARVPGAELHNLYGPTEAAVDVTQWTCRAGAPLVPIGKPIHNVRIHLLDERMEPVPAGVRGELHIGGVQVARGYLNRPDLTAERFVPDPFASGGRLYKTGDVARYLPSGDIEYKGRVDHQVKIRGHRIELGEIEADLARHPAVLEAVAIVREDVPGDKRIIAYLVLQEVEAPTVADLRAFLAEKLPEHMLPSAFVLLDDLPLTASGKIDRRALPAPEDADRPALSRSFAAPRTSVEERLAAIWASVLRLERAVGIDDNFFEIGGDSILSIQVVSRAQQAGLRITPRQLFQHPTIAGLASVAVSAAAISAEQGLVTGRAPLTPIAQWWVEQAVADPHHWNQAFFLQAREPRAPFDAAALDRAIACLVEHHDALRVRLSRAPGGAWEQTLSPPGGPNPLRLIDLRDVPDADLPRVLEEAAADAQASLDLAAGPALRIVLFDCGPERPNRLLLVIHHLAVDGVSWRILFEDLFTAYEQSRRGQPPALPPKTTSLQRWSERLVEHARSLAVSAEAAYWLDPRRARLPRVPLDAPLGDNTEASVATVRASLGEAETRSLLRDVPEAYQTQINDVLLAAFAHAIARWCGAHSALVDLEGHGREDLFDDVDLTRTVGWFTTVYPALLHVSPGIGPGAALKSIKEQLRAVPARGLGHGLLRYLREGDTVSAELRALPQAEVSFNYLGQLDQALPDDSPFSFARESSGPPRSPRALRRYLVDTTAGISGGRLEIRWIYSENVHRRATIEALSERFLAALRALIAHCLSPEAGGYTPSDFQEEGLSQDVIDMLARMDGEGDEDDAGAELK